MAFRPPRLDDRRYNDLVAELVARIPAHTPEWTHPRVGDPGRTLIELFAWLGDAILYRANLIPERQRLAFLRLLGQPVRGALPARGIVTLQLKENEAIRSTSIRPLARFQAQVPFEARNEFSVLPISGASFYKRPTRPGEVGADVIQALAEFHLPQTTHSTAAASAFASVSTYVTTPLFSENRPERAGFDVVQGSSDRCLWIALLAPKAPAPESQPSYNAQATAALAAGDRPLLNVGFVPDLPSTDPLEPATARARIPHVWEITVDTPGGLPAGAASPPSRWTPQYLALDEIADSTAGLTREGVVRLALPRTDILHAPENDVRVDENAGVGDRPPRLEDLAIASRLIAWVRLRPSTPVPSIPPNETQFQTGQGAASLHNASGAENAAVREVEQLRVLWLGINAVEVEQLTTRSRIVIGESNGASDQEFQLPAAPVEQETFHLQVEEPSGWQTWHRVEDLAALDREAASSRDARAFQLDAASGIVRFGDGIRGRVPATGTRIRVAQMRTGGGSAGNLPAGSILTVAATAQTGESVGSRFDVLQARELVGGLDAESLAEAERRIPGLIRHRQRAVTADDYRTLARETPGVSVGRVELMPGFKPQQRHFGIPGVVTVLALPSRPLAPAPNPRSDRPFLEAVHAWLDARRPLTTELYIIGCEYVPVALTVAVTLAGGAEPDTVRQAIRDALRRVLWPLAPGGFDGAGWPLGRGLSNRELAVEVARVPGVSEIAGLNLFRKLPASNGWQPLGDSRDGREQNLELEPWQLPELLGVGVLVDSGTGSGAPLEFQESGSNPFAGDNALAVPVVPDLC